MAPFSVPPLPVSFEEQEEFYHYYNAMVYRFDTSHGELLWQTSLSRVSTQPNDGILCIADGVVYVFRTFNIAALDTTNGELLWQVSNASGERYRKSVIKNGRIYLYSDEDTFSAFDAHDGSLLWQKIQEVYNFRVCNGQLYATLSQGRHSELYALALDGATGEIRWSVGLKLVCKWLSQDGLPSLLVAEDGVVYIIALDSLFALNEQSGEIIWQQVVPDTSLYNPFLANGIIYVESPAPAPTPYMLSSTPTKGVSPATIVALDARTGQILWVIGPGYDRVPGARHSLHIVDGLLLANGGQRGTGRGGIVGIDVQTGKVALSYPLHDAIVTWWAIRHGILYLLESVDLPQEEGSFTAKRDFLLKSFHPGTARLLSAHLLASGESTFHVKGIGNGLLYQFLAAPRMGFSPSYKYSIVAYHLSDGSHAWSYSMPPLS